MKKIFVVLFFISLAFADWQQRSEIALPKGIRVNDLTISYSGEIWILSASSLLKFEASKSPLLIQEISDGKTLAAQDKVYILDNLNRLLVLDPATQELAKMTNLAFSAPAQISTITIDKKEGIVVLESNQLFFIAQQTILGSISTAADKFSVIPLADYGNPQTPLFTIINNQIYSWKGGTYMNTKGYRGKVLYSATNSILDFTADRSGNLFVLFSDSIVVLDADGNYNRKIRIDNLPYGSKILTNPVNNNLILFDRLSKTLKTLTNVSTADKYDIITLSKNRPNPVDNYTEIEFTLNQALSLTITVYNLIGEPVKVIARGHYPKGIHHVVWHADDESGNPVPNGVYFYRLESSKGVEIRQLIVLR